MTRSAWLTVRLPGASTAPATSTRTWFQTGAVKQSRKADSQAVRTCGVRFASLAADLVRVRWVDIAFVESNHVRAARVLNAFSAWRRRGHRSRRRRTISSGL